MYFIRHAAIDLFDIHTNRLVGFNLTVFTTYIDGYDDAPFEIFWYSCLR